MKKILFVALALTILVGCSHTVKYDQTNAVSSRSVDGKVDVYEQGETISKTYKKIGNVWLGDSGVSESCGYEDALFLARAKAREVGADAIVVKQIKKPGFISTCYRVNVDIIEYQ